MLGGRWAALAAVVVIVTGLAGCSGSSKPPGTDIAIVTPGTRDDPDWTAQHVRAIQKIAHRLHVRAVIVDGSKATNVRAAIERAGAHAQLLDVPYPGDRATAMAVAARTHVPTLVWGDPRALRKDHVADLEYAAAAGAYGMGAMSIHASLFRAVGIVLCNEAEPLEMANRYRMASDYVAGALAQNPKSYIFYQHTGDGSPVSDAQAQAATERLARKGRAIRASGFVEPGAEFVFADCGKAMAGVMKGVIRADAEHQMVAVTGEKTSVNQNNMLLTTIRVHPEIAIEQALRDIRAGRFGTHAYTLDFANRGASLYRTGRTPSDAWDAGFLLTRKASAGQVTLPEATTEAALEQYLAGKLAQ